MSLNNKKRILIVDDDDILMAGKLLLKKEFGEIVTCNHPRQIPQKMSEQIFDAILLDMNFSLGNSDG